MLKLPHYQFSPELRPRYKKDSFATDITTRARAMTFDLLESLRPAIQQPRLVSSAFGEIDRLLFTIPSYVFQFPAYSNVYEDLLRKLPAAANFVILVQGSVRNQVDAMVARVGATSRTTIINAPNFMRFTVWAEDGYAITQDNGTGPSHFVEPASFPRQEDALIADIVSANSDINLYHASLYFQGGNILIGDNFWLLGADYANKSLDLGLIRVNSGEAPLDAVRREYGASLDRQKTLNLVASTVPVPSQTERPVTIEGQDWTEELYAGNAPGTVQPMFHIDMFVTLAGRDAAGRPIALVGDPRMAAQTLGETVQPHAMVGVYDNISANLELQGFTVIRNPLPLVYQDDAREKKRYWYFATANNALVEITATSKKVWIPTYGYGAWSDLAATDNENKRIWERLGFTVAMLGDFHPFAFNLGAVHCIKKYLGRQ